MCKREQTPAKEPLKTWPINAYERPEYNPSTNQVEPLDCVMKNSETHLVSLVTPNLSQLI